VISLRAQVAAAFAAVYIIWGSTYLAIRFVIETLPPFFMAGTRFVIAGVVLYILVRVRGASKATLPQWRSAAVVGGLMLMGGHGAVVWSEQWVPSGLASLLIACVPLWFALLIWLYYRTRPSSGVVAGLILGFAGVGLLVGRVGALGGSQVDIVGAAVIVTGALLWASGSLYSRSARLPSSQLLATAMEMIVGGILLLLASLATGEWMRVRLDQVSLRSTLSWVYLIVFGSLIGFTCYMWLLKVATTEHVSTYAYVNPVVALFLGWALASETLTAQDMVAAAIILASVAVITKYGVQHSSREHETVNGKA
jgi:drug/metabolite transporter (DMT)-like permease